MFRFPKIEGSRGFAVEQRQKHSIKIALSFYLAVPPQILLLTNYTPTTLMETAQKQHLLAGSQKKNH